jgi:hypothetical protein
VTRLQGLSTLLNQQKTQLEGLIQSLLLLCEVKGPHNAEALAHIDGTTNVIRGSYSVALANAQAFIQDQGSFVIGTLDTLPAEDTERVVRSVASLFAGLVEGISAIVAPRDRNNDASSDSIPPVLPHDLCHLRTSTVCISIRHHKVRL